MSSTGWGWQVIITVYIAVKVCELNIITQEKWRKVGKIHGNEKNVCFLNAKNGVWKHLSLC